MEVASPKRCTSTAASRSGGAAESSLGQEHKMLNCNIEKQKTFVALFFFSNSSRIARTFLASTFRSAETSQSTVDDMDVSEISDIARTA